MRLPSDTRRGKKTVTRTSVREQLDDSLRRLVDHLAGWVGTLEAMEEPAAPRKRSAAS
jgi:hypothetical protein